MSGKLHAKFGIQQEKTVTINKGFDTKVWLKVKRCWYYHNAYCYDSSSSRYYCYGQKGWTVCKEWNCFNPFGLMNFYKWAKEYFKTEDDLKLYLDKDLLDTGLKSIRPESCRWVTNSENTKERNNRYKDQQREIMRAIGLKNKGNKTITEKQRLVRSLNAKRLNEKRWKGEHNND